MVQTVLATTSPSPSLFESPWDTAYLQLIKKIRICFTLSVCAMLLALGATCYAIVTCSPQLLLAFSILALGLLLITSLLLTFTLKHRLYGSLLSKDISKDIKKAAINSRERLDSLFYDLTYTYIPQLQHLYSETQAKEIQIKRKEEYVQELQRKLQKHETEISSYSPSFTDSSCVSSGLSTKFVSN